MPMRMEWIKLIFVTALVLCSVFGLGNTKKCSSFLVGNTLTLPTDLKAGESCTWPINAKDNATTSMAFHLTDVSIGAKASLVLYDGDTETANLVFNMSESSVTSDIAVLFQQTANVVLSVKEDNTEVSGKILLNIEECSVSLTNSLALGVGSPMVVKSSTQDVTCTYQVANALPLDKMAIVSILTFTLGQGSSLNIVSGKLNHTYNGDDKPGPQPDFFTEPDSDSVTVTFTIKQKADAADKTQDFQLAFQPFVKSCTGDQVLEKTAMTFIEDLANTPGVDAMCRLRLTALDSGVSAVSVLVHSLELSALDQVTIVAGSSSSVDQPLHQSSGSLSPDYLVLVPASSLTITISFSTAVFKRQVNMTAGPLSVGGRFNGKGTLVAGTGKASGVSANDTITANYQLVATEGQMVQLDVKTTLPSGASLTLYKGLQVEDGVLIVLDSKAASLGLQQVVGQAEMLVVLDGFSASENFTAVFASVPSGCDQLVTEPFGQLNHKATKNHAVCTWTIAPNGKGMLVLTFDTLTLAKGSSVKVFTHPDQTIADLEGPDLTRPLPQIYVEDGVPARVSIHQADDQTQDNLVISYKSVMGACGGDLEDSHAALSTPNFPNQYPLNAQCQWSNSKGKPLLYLSFDTLHLAQKHSISVLEVVNATQDTLATYMGSASTSEELPKDLIVPANNKTLIQFSSVAPAKMAEGKGENAVGTGAMLDYWLLECGGNVTGVKGSFSSPGFPQASAATTCVWIVKLPPLTPKDDGDNDSQSVQFNVKAVGKQVKEINKYLKIYDGPSQRFPLSTANSSNGTSGMVLSRYDSLTVIFALTKATDQVAFNLTFTQYVCNVSIQCDNGLCMHKDWVCNGKDDCGDASDERHCVFPRPTPAPPQDHSGYVKMGWVPGCLFIGIFLGAALLFIVPRIIRHFRSGSSNSYNRMSDDRPVMA